MNASHVIESLVDVVAKGGNLLLDIGPDEHGKLPAPAVASMEEVGRWLGIHGEAIYDSGATRPHALFGGCRSAAFLFAALSRVDESIVKIQLRCNRATVATRLQPDKK